MAYTPNTQEQQDEIVERAENNGTTSNATAKDFVKKDARGAVLVIPNSTKGPVAFSLGELSPVTGSTSSNMAMMTGKR